MKPRQWIGAALVLGLLVGAATAAEPEPAAREQVGKPVQQAQALVRQRKFAEALTRLQEADAVPNKSPYETYVIEETRAAAEIETGDYAAAVKALEAVLATHTLPQAEASKRVASVVLLEYQIKDFARAVEYAQRYYKEGGADPEPRRVMAQSYYLLSDLSDAVKTIREVLAADQRAEKAPDETLLRTLAESEFRAQNSDGYVDALTRLVASHPKHDYWVQLCRAVAQKPGFAPRLRLDLYRIEVAAGAVDAPEQFVEAAQLALEAGFPGDAKAFLAHGYAASILGKGPQADRQKRLTDMADRQAGDDQKALAAQAREAAAASNGLALEKLGEAYASYGRYEDAAAALEGSLRKGGLQHPDDARLHLGVAYLKGRQSAKAKDDLNAINAADGARDLARLWLIQAAAE